MSLVDGISPVQYLSKTTSPDLITAVRTSLYHLSHLSYAYLRFLNYTKFWRNNAALDAEVDAPQCSKHNHQD